MHRDLSFTFAAHTSVLRHSLMQCCCHHPWPAGYRACSSTRKGKNGARALSNIGGNLARMCEQQWATRVGSIRGMEGRCVEVPQPHRKALAPYCSEGALHIAFAPSRMCVRILSQVHLSQDLLLQNPRKWLPDAYTPYARCQILARVGYRLSWAFTHAKIKIRIRAHVVLMHVRGELRLPQLHLQVDPSVQRGYGHLYLR